MATLLTTAGTIGERIMTKNTYVMVHQFSDSIEGKYHELVAMRKSQDDLHRRFIKHFVDRTKMSEKQVKDILMGSSDKWLTAKEALKYGLCDKIQQPWV
jgi:ATP-dependent protease ClpP protease subunit